MKLAYSSRASARLARRVGALAAVSLVLAACGDGNGDGGAGADGNGGDDATPYRIGVLVGLTGSYAALGDPEHKAVELYFDDVNDDGGIDGHPVELVVLDTASNESTAVNQFRRLAIEEEVHAVIGPSSSGESIALRTFSKDLTVPTIGLASSSAIVEPPEESTYMFKQYTGTNESLMAQLQFTEEQGWDKVALLYANDGYGQDPANRIDTVAEDFDLSIVAKEAFDPASTDVTAQLSKIAQSDPDVVLVWAVMPANAVVAKSAESIGLEQPLFHSPGAGSAAYVDSGGTAANGSYLQGSVVLAPDSLEEGDAQYEATMRLVEAYTDAHSEAPGQYAANGWDGATIVTNAISQAAEHDPSDVQGTRDAIRDSMESNTTDIVGVNAVYTFTPEFHGSVSLGGLAVLLVEDGQFQVEQTY